MEFVIDHRIRDWVFIPILYVMFMCGLLKIFIQKVMNAKKPVTGTTAKAVEDARQKCVLMRAQKLGSTNSLLTNRGWHMRRHWFLKAEGQLFEHENDAEEDAMAAMSKGNPMMNPNNMADMLKNNLFMTVITPMQFGFISYFFTGYIVGKVPFPLTQKFREMLQRGVENVALDVKYVSALSLYFLTIFGFNSVYRMILSGDNDDALNPMNDPSMNPMAMNPMGGGANPMSGPPNTKKMFATERENLNMIQHDFSLGDPEKILVDRWNAIKACA
jgi:hypothetical protein